MKTLAYQIVVEAVSEMCISACHELPSDVLAALERALTQETGEVARDVLERLIENARVASDQQIPLCQDTGLTVVFLELGTEVRVTPPTGRPEATILDAIQDGVRQGYGEGFLRMSVVGDPLHERINTQTNTPAVVHTSLVPGETIKLSIMAKGGGCENKSQFRMFLPTSPAEDVMAWIAQVAQQAGANACPPLVVGVGLGGNFEVSCRLSKQALLRRLDESHSDPYYARMEAGLLERINQCGVGPQGLGGRTTALGVMIETAPCHIASLPVAVNIECHSHRHKTVELS